jgi:actin related protein 2/3 complex subunit 3
MSVSPGGVDEALDLFKANIFFSTYEVKGKADRILIYCTLYVILCLKKLAKCPNSAKAVQDMYSLALQRFAVPGDADFPLNAFYEKPKSSSETDEIRRYLTQLRVEIGYRLIEKVFDPSMSVDDKPSKWWICFSRRKFLNLALSK